MGSQVDQTNPAIKGGTDALMQQLLANPLSMGQQQVQMLQEQQKEQALAQQNAMMQALGRRQAASGFDVPGGAFNAQQQQAGQATQAALLGSNRDISLAKMQQDQQDRLNALQAGQGYMGAESGRQTGLFNAQNDVALRAQQLALQRILGQGGLNLDQQRLSQQGSQFNRNFGLDQSRLLNDMLMGRANYGLNMTGLQQNAQNNMFSQLFGGG